ncbi:MAG: glycerol-3-phosphate 1-O-acyltransferase PlsY [Methyloversatilis sp.]|uniref:glycerol-3-phosphate 1-O-acyltransferase PlsY n=1 Tax=Methyloversatilis sp. TaxID=2569862 RepID=UPI002734013A|nr:glycerol-3-phosphate 1-O-acyltransferase PlsY [Methyloversatilis sp.]MDP3874511.1 glycerol-3-phosphate 1-O-acyltransferase PlsY [Methyloversatilis sp.]
MNTASSIALALVIGYAFGCIPFAVITSRIFGLADPRSYGSGNPGATNVLRSGNKKAAVLTLLGDALKGCVAVWVVRALGMGDTMALLAGVAAFVGHVFPATLGFRGGKGVATAAGVMLVAVPPAGVIALGIWIGVVVVTRYSSLAALLAACSAPITGLLYTGSAVVCGAFAAMAGLLIWRHAENIRRLMNGSESRIGRKKTAAG